MQGTIILRCTSLAITQKVSFCFHFFNLDNMQIGHHSESLSASHSCGTQTFWRLQGFLSSCSLLGKWRGNQKRKGDDGEQGDKAIVYRLSQVADFVSNRAVRNRLPDNEVISLLPQSRCLRHKKRGKTGTCVER